MTTRPSWPDAFRTAPFTVADATAYGIGRRRANGARVLRPHRHLRSLTPVTAPLDLCRGLATTLPAGVAFSHVTALRLWGLPTPTPWALEEPVHIMHPFWPRRIRRDGIVAHAGLDRRATCTRRGLLLTGMVDTWADMAALPGTSVADLVVVGDAILHRRGKQALPELHAAARGRHGFPGVVLLREAVDLVRVGSRSPMETVTRLDFAEQGLPEAELNADITDHVGQWIARPDFVWRARRTIAEYDGLGHGGRRQFRRDASRRRLIEDADWQYVQLTATTLSDPVEHAAIIDRLRRHLLPGKPTNHR